MTNVRLLIIAILLSAAAATLLLSVIAWRRRASTGPAAFFFSLSMAAVTIYSFGYAMEVSHNALPEIMFWVRFQHWGIQVVTPAWLLFSIYLAGEENLLTTRRIAAVWIVPVLMFLSTQTLGGHNLWHLYPHLNTSGPFPTFTYHRGIISLLGTAYSSLCLAFSTILFAVTLSRAAPALRKQSAILLTGSLIPWLGMLLYMTGLTPYNLDITPFALSLSGFLFALGFLKFGLLHIIPLARGVIFEGMNDGVLVLDTQDRIIDFNPRLQEILPAVRKTSVGYPVFGVLASYPVLAELIKENVPTSAELQTDRDGETRYYQSRLTPLLNRKRMVGKIVTMHDHTQVKHLLGRLEDLATLDGLTNVFNRRHFNDLATKEVYRCQRYGGPLSLIVLDIDHFKRVNDTHGHMAGDAVLRAVAQVCRHALRQSDILGRFGGEEFVILLPGTDQTAAEAIAHKLRIALEQLRIEYDDRSIVVTASFGVAGVMFPAGASLDELFRRADQAVYEAKEKGRNRVSLCAFVDPAPDGLA